MEKNNILKTFLNFSIGSWISLIIGMVSAPIVTRLLDPSELGKSSMFTLIINIGVIIILCGTDQYYIRYYYEEVNKKKLLKKCLKICVGVFLIVSFIIVNFRENLLIFMFEEYKAYICVLILISLFFQVLNSFLLIIVRMEQKGKTFSFLIVLNRFFIFIFSLLFLFLGKKDYIISFI